MRDRVRRKLRTYGLLVAVALVLGCVVAPSPAIADDQVVCVELPYDGPPLPAGVEIGTALKCEKLSYEQANEAEKDASSTTQITTPSQPSNQVERRPVPAQPADPESVDFVPASNMQNESAPSGGPNIALLVMALLLPLTLRFGWSIVAHRRAAGVATLAAD